MPYKKVARMPAGWNDTGAFALTEKSMKKYIELIGNRLPDDICWCGDDTLIAPVGFDAESFNINKIVHEAMREILACDEPGIWEDE